MTRRYTFNFEQANIFWGSEDEIGLTQHTFLYIGNNKHFLKYTYFHRITFFLKKSGEKLAFVFMLFVYLIAKY